MSLVMSPDSSYARYDAPTPVDHGIVSPAHRDREPELHIGTLTTLQLYLHYHMLACNYVFVIILLCTYSYVTDIRVGTVYICSIKIYYLG